MNPVFEPFIARYRQSADTRAGYRSDLRDYERFLNGKDPITATKADLDGFARSLEERGLAERSIRRKLACLKKFYRYLMSLDVITKDNTCVFDDRAAKTLVKNPKALSEEQRTHLINSLRYKTNHEWRISLAMLIGLYTGMRRSEICHLKWEDIDFGKKTIFTVGKGSKQMIKFMPDYLIEKLKEYKTDREVNEGLVLNIGRSRIGLWIKTVRKWCAWDKDIVFTMHVLRHTYVTHLLNEGVDLRMVSKLAGHNNIETTMTYAKLNDKELKNAFNEAMNK